MPHRAKAISDTLSHTCGTAEGTEAALLTLSSFLFSTPDRLTFLQRQEALDECHALSKLVELQAMYHDTATIQTVACKVLSALCLEETTRPTHLSMLEVVETLLTTLRKHRGDTQIIGLALRALASTAQLPDVRTRVLPRCGAIRAAVESGAHGIELARFFAQACIRCEWNKQQVVQGGGLECLIDDNGNGVNNAIAFCVAIRNISVGGGEAIVYAGRIGVVEKVMYMVERFGYEVKVAKHALAALYHLVVLRENVERVLGYDGWAGILVGLAERHESIACVQTLVFGVGDRVGEVGVEAFVAEGGVRVGLKAMHKFVTRRGVLYWGARFVGRLVEKGGMQQLKEGGGVEGLLDILYCSVVRPVGEVHEFCAGYAEVV